MKEDDAIGSVTAKVEIAWKYNTDRHRILFKQNDRAVVPHLIAHEMEHILLEHEAREV